MGSLKLTPNEHSRPGSYRNLRRANLALRNRPIAFSVVPDLRVREARMSINVKVSSPVPRHTGD